MNERIRELAKQATKQYSPTYYTQEWIQGFAELIVRECIDTAFHRGHPDLEFLLKHFGVE